MKRKERILHVHVNVMGGRETAVTEGASPEKVKRRMVINVFIKGGGICPASR